MSTEAIDKEIAEIDSHIELNACLKRLMLNSDFKKVITDGYFKDYASDLVCQLDFPEHAPIRDQFEKSINGISGLAVYFREVSSIAEQAEKSREASLDARNAILEEA